MLEDARELKFEPRIQCIWGLSPSWLTEGVFEIVKLSLDCKRGARGPCILSGPKSSNSIIKF